MTKDQEQVREQNQGQGQEQPKTIHSFWYRHWHGIVQILTILFAAALSLALAYGWFFPIPQIYDLILYMETIWTLAIAVICSHAYNYYPGSEENPLRDKAAKKQATWRHGNYCWKILSVWMTVTPLYCTCATIYISGNYSGDTFDQTHVLVYSILSLVISLGTYVIRPSNRATGYREACLIVTTALTIPGSDVANALIEGEKVVAKQDTMDPS